MRWPPLRGREVLRPTEQQDPHFLHKPDTFPLDTQRLAPRWCSLKAASGETYSKHVQTFTKPYRGHVMTPCQIPRISGIVRFSEDLYGWIMHAAEVISTPVGGACPSLICTRPTHVAKASHRIFHSASGHDFMCRIADLQFLALKP